MNRKMISAYTPVAVGILFAGAFLRFFGINFLSFSSSEAAAALQAVDLAHGVILSDIFQPAYSLLSAIFFRLFGANALFARLIPAVAGTALIGLVLFAQKWIGKKRALLCALLFAFDPVLILWSKQAGSATWVLFFCMAAVFCFLEKRNVGFILCLVATLAGGGLFWSVALSAGTVALAWLFFNRADARKIFCTATAFLSRRDWIIGVAVLSVFLTLFWSRPIGISAIGSAFAQGADSSMNIGVLPFIFLVVFSLGLPFAFVLIRCVRSGNFLPLLYGAVFTVVMLFLGEGVRLFLFLVPLLWLFGSGVIIGLLERVRFNLCLSWLACAVCAWISCAFLFLRLTEMLRIVNIREPMVFFINQVPYSLPLSRFAVYLLIIGVCIALMILLLKMAIDYFQSETAVSGLIFGSLLFGVMCLLSHTALSAGFGAIGNDRYAVSVGGLRHPALGDQMRMDTDIFMRLLQDADMKTNGGFARLNVLSETQNPLVRWEMRGFENVRYGSVEQADLEKVQMIVTQWDEMREIPGFTQAKVNFSLDNWRAYGWRDWTNWLIYHETPVFEHPIAVYLDERLLTE